MRDPLKQSHSTPRGGNQFWEAEEANKPPDISSTNPPTSYNILYSMPLEDVGYGNSVAQEPIEACVHSLVKRVVCKRPWAPAIRSWDGCDFTYQQLDQISSKLAHQLLAMGIKPQAKVVLCFEKAWGFAPVCLLALMKAGATSVALDLTQPKEQLQAIAAKTSPSIVLSSPANQKAARQLGVAEVVVLNREILTRPASASAPFDELPVVNPSDLVCVVFNPDYESGAFITHRDFCSAITYKQSALGFNNNSRVLELESYTSLAAWYSLLTLTCGGCICTPSQAGLTDNLESSISRLQANCALATPTSARKLICSKLSRLIQLRYITYSDLPSDRGDSVQDGEGGSFVIDRPKGRTNGHREHVEFSQPANGSVHTAHENSWLERDVLHGSAILSFSLLSSYSSVQKDEMKSHAARLCHVRESQVVDMMPCTPLQEGLLALSTKRPGDYVARFIFDIGNDIDTERLRRAWNRVIALIPILRTRIVSLPGFGLMQVVLEDAGVIWTAESDIDSSLQGSQGQGRGRDEHTMGLGAPLTKLAISKKAKDGPCQLLWDIHHALYDGYSLPLLLNEVEHAYFDEPSQGLQSMTAFIKYIKNQDEATERAFWQDVFADTQGSHFPSPKAGYHPHADCRITTTISDLNWGHSDYTPATIIRAAWSVITAKGAGSNEALFGVAVTGRQAPVPDIELIAGPTSATLPIRILIDWDASFNQLLNSVQRQSVEMIPYEQTGLQRIARFSEETAKGSAFQSLLVVQPASRGESEPSRPFLSEPADASRETQWQDFSTYSIIVECQLESDRAHFLIDFDSSVIGREQMECISQHLTYTISQLSKSKLGDQSLRSLADNQWDLNRIWTWNAVVPQSTEMCVHDLFSQRVSENPSATAISAWDGDLTYGQLDALSTNLAHQLSAKGIAKTIVPLVFGKSCLMPVAALAVIKAGGACVAVDTKQPPGRLSAIIAQANSSIILSSEQNEVLTRQLYGKMKDIVIVGPQQSFSVPVHSKLPFVSSSDTLYLVFTSGSTGTPKGVIVTHKNFCSAITHQQKALGFSSTTRVFDFASYAFDVSWGNLLHALTVGGTLCIPSQDERDNDLAGCLEKYQVTIVDLTPSVARIVGRESLSRLSTLILGGDAVLPGDVNLADSNTTIINAYGPAECTPTSTFAQVTPDSFGIGYGAGVCTWVVDDNGSLASVGSIGELWLEGPLVGEGYLNDPKKTAATFVENPPWLLRGVLERPALQARPGRHGRLYRTGDLVQQREDGSLVFVGRKDTQVKIRGQRVELGDVEQHVVEALRDASSAASLDVAQVQAIAEMIQPDWANSAILVAFISLEYSGNKNMTEESHTLAVHQTTDALADRLKDKVPTYMVPMAFIPIFKLPTTTTGKIDRKRLRTIGGSVYMPHRKSPGRKEQKESLSELEAILQQVWMSVLNLSSEDASIDAAFMRLGGDSISAMQVVSRGRLHNLEFTIGDLLKAGTIRKLAARCQIISQDAKQESEEHIQDDRDTGEWFEISPIQQSFFDIYPNGLNHFNQTFVLELSKAVPTAILSNAYHTLVRRHSMLRARFNKNHDSGLWMQRAAQEDDMQSFAFTEHFVEHRGDFARAAQLRQESLDIEHGPVFAFDLFIIPDGSQILVLSSHHLVIDLVSWRIIWNDIEEFIAHGKLLSQPTTSFQRWCRRQAKIGHNLSPLSVLPYSIPEPQLSFWGLPVRDNTFANRQFYTEIFEEDVSKPLFGVCNEILKTEPVDIILGAMVYSFLHTFPERTVPVIWIEGHGREQSHDMPHDVSGTVGWFTTIYPLDIPITLESTVFDAVRLAKDTKRKIPGNGRPFFACRYHSESGRDAFQGHDVVEVTFNFTGRYQQLEREEGLFTRSDSLREVESAIVDVSGSAQRFTMIEITADVDEGLLDVTFQVHKAMKHQDRLREWTEAFYETLESLTEALLRSTPSFTLSDLPLLPLSYSGLDTLLKKQLPSMGIRTDAVSDIYPVSPLQEGMLLSSQKGTSSYATISIWQCVPSDTSAISPSRLEAAWRTVVGRHTILQTVFSLHPEGNGFIQLVVPGSKIRVVHMTVEEDNPTVILSRLETPTFAANEPEHAFTICQSTMGEVACRLDASHSLVDASSMTIIVSDIISVYDCCDLAPAPLFSEMIRHINSGPKAQRISSWTKLLDGVEPCEFPTSSLRPEQAASESHSDVAIPANLTTGITQFCKKLCITRAVFLQVAWAMTLSQMTGHREVIFGYLASGRDSPVSGIESMVGPLANMLVSRIDLRLPAKQVLKITSEKSMEHLTLQHVSLAEIQHQLGLGGRRLFNTSLSVQEVEKFTSTEKRSLSFESQDGEDPHEYDLKLSAIIDGDSMDIMLEFREPYIRRYVAKETSIVLTKAIQYLLAINGDDMYGLVSTESLMGGFFKNVVGADEQLTREFWRTHFAEVQDSYFPPRKEGKHQPRPDREVTLCAQELEWANRGDFSATTILKAAWSILTTRILGSNEAIFGVTTTDQKAVMPVRVLLDSESIVIELLQKIQRQAADMALFERTGLQRIRSISEEASLGCDFQSLLHVVDRQIGEHRSPLLDRTAEEWQQRFDNHAMVIECQIQKNETITTIKFDSDMIGELQVTRIGHQFEHILRQLLHLDLRDQKLGDLAVVSPRDVNDIWSWNATVPEPVDECVHDMVFQRAHEQPLASAIHAWDGDLTYRQLLRLSTELAHELVKKGVGPGNIVPLCFEKSMWMSVAALALTQTGAAAVALDPVSQTEDRMRAITIQVKGNIILSSVANEALAYRLGINDVVVVGPKRLSLSFRVHDTLGTITQRRLGSPAASPSDVLYVMFTSGAGGIPKGVQVLHRNFSSAIAYQQGALGYTQSARVLDFSSYACDVFWSSLLNTLTAGACFCIPQAAELKDNLSACLEKYKITLADFTPSIARHTSGLSSLSTLILGGDLVLQADMSLAGEKTQVRRVWGPSECTPIATILERSTGGDIELGRGAGVCTWVTAPGNPGLLAPVGAVGELWLEGPLVGEGYLDDPQMTATAFIEDPAWLLRGIPGGKSGRRGRVFRTGKLVQYREDGSLSFVGREDTKIRGQHVDLDEVERCLRQVMGSNFQVVAEAIRPRSTESEILATFITLEDAGEEHDAKVKHAIVGINDKLAEALPPFMIPTLYIPLQRLPKMATGKIDRTKLRALGSSLTAKDLADLSRSNGEGRAPKSNVEGLLQGLWADVLKLEPDSISREDSFFRLGGDSIGAMQLVGMTRQKGLSLTVRDIFQNPILGDLAAVCTCT